MGEGGCEGFVSEPETTSWAVFDVLGFAVETDFEERCQFCGALVSRDLAGEELGVLLFWGEIACVECGEVV